MSNINIIFLGLLFAIFAKITLAKDLNIPQVSDQRSKADNADDELSISDMDKCKNDYQKQVLSNPQISDIARTEALTNGGGNTSIITQNGSNNYAKQIQKGSRNYLYLEQTGRNNCSQEIQTGQNNRKIKIQNSQKEETNE